MEISKTNSNIINLKKNIYITTPKMRIPFKIENRYKNYYIKIEFSNLSKDSKMNEFYNNFSRLETSLVEQINKKFNFDYVYTQKGGEKDDWTLPNIKLLVHLIDKSIKR